jgi:heat shock protein beta
MFYLLFTLSFLFLGIFNQAVLEINPSHPIIQNLQILQESDSESVEAKETVELIFNTAALAAGYVLDNAADYSQMVVKLMTKLAHSK